MAVPSEVRQHAVDAYRRGEGTIQEIAARFDIGSASLARWLKRFRSTGSVEREPRSGGKPRKISTDGEALLRRWLDENPALSQSALAKRLADAGHPAVSQQTVGRTLQRMGVVSTRGRGST